MYLSLCRSIVFRHQKNAFIVRSTILHLKTFLGLLDLCFKNNQSIKSGVEKYQHVKMCFASNPRPALDRLPWSPAYIQHGIALFATLIYWLCAPPLGTGDPTLRI